MDMNQHQPEIQSGPEAGTSSSSAKNPAPTVEGGMRSGNFFELNIVCGKFHE